MPTERFDIAALAPRGFVTDADHLAEEVAWVGDLVRLAIRESRAERGPSAQAPVDEFSGMFVSEQDIDRFLSGRPAASETTSDPAIAALRSRIAARRAEIDATCAQARARGTPSRLDRLLRRFGLNAPTRTALLCSLAPEFDSRLQEALGYFQDEAGRRRPSVALLARLAGHGAAPLAIWREFGPDSPLFAERLLILPEDAGGRPFAGREPRVADTVVAYVSGRDGLDPLLGWADLILGPAPGDGATRYGQGRRALAGRIAEAPRPTYLWGVAGTDPGAMAQAVAHAMGRPCLRLEVGRPPVEDRAGRQIRAVLRRDALLQNALVHLDLTARFDDPKAAETAQELGRLLTALAGIPVVVTGTEPLAALRRHLPVAIEEHRLSLPEIDERAELWAEVLPPSQAALATVLAGKFRFGPAQIRQAAATSEVIGADSTDATSTALHAACRRCSAQGLHRYAHPVNARLGWADLVLPEDSLRQLHEICACVDHRQTVFGRWGFDGKFSLGKGLCVLFSGASGTGKTMTAEIMAHALGQDMYKIDLSAVVSKYIGETEQNLARIFDEAEDSNAILFFDEADALFGRRSEVKDAHDRYANIEINYLLQKLDEFEGIVVLASNMKGNFDTAFMRRLNYVVEFPFPDKGFRERIWQQVFPEQTPLSKDIDFDFLADRFQLSGGNIKNIAINAAFLAASEDTAVRMRHVIFAVRREQQKLGKLCTKSEYGPYFRALKMGGLE